MKAPNLNYLWAALLVEELARNGVRHFIVSPGSRSAPLAVAASQNAGISTLVHFDERGAAYCALGSSRAGHPAAVICTSGTAVANYWPAVAEASHSALPLVLLTADRPPELQDCGANQTMEQEGIFADYVRARLNLPCPDPSFSAESLLYRLNNTLAKGLSAPRGPIHINCKFREPLAPIDCAEAWQDSYLEGLGAWFNHEKPFNRSIPAQRSLSKDLQDELIERIHQSRRGLVLVGRTVDDAQRKEMMELINTLGWPVFADITSGCRNNERIATLVPYYNLLLRSEKFRQWFKPDLILHLGGAFVSKALPAFVQNQEAPYIHLSPEKRHGGLSNRVTIGCSIDLKTLLPALESFNREKSRTADWEVFRKMNEGLTTRLRQYRSKAESLNEIEIAAIIDQELGSENALFLGNSMPVRDMDQFATRAFSRLIHANRGLSGIDGNIATAAGIAWGSGVPVTAVIGDMAALHDLNSLALLQHQETPVILVVINNGGGGIFSFLPIAEYKEPFGRYFATSHSYRFKEGAALFSLDYVEVSTSAEFCDALQKAKNKNKSSVIEVTVCKEINLKFHKNCYEAATLWIDQLVDSLR